MMDDRALDVKGLNIVYTSYHSMRVRNLLSGRRAKSAPIHAIKDLSFSVSRGEVLGVVGLNGSGKTTLLRAIAGVFAPDSGSIELYGNRASLMALGVGFDPELSGKENIVLSGMMLGFSRREIQSRIDEIIEFSELNDFIDYPVRTYSSGMHARLAFSVTSFLKTDVMLVDEVMSVGDAHFREKSGAKMQELIADKRHSVVLVSHDEELVRDTCSRAVWLDKGSLKMEGDTGTVLAEYRNFLDRMSEEP